MLCFRSLFCSVRAVGKTKGGTRSSRRAVAYVARVALPVRGRRREAELLQLTHHVLREFLAGVVREHDEADARALERQRLVLLLPVELAPLAVAVQHALVGRPQVPARVIPEALDVRWPHVILHQGVGSVVR